jgi:hypothetical protein
MTEAVPTEQKEHPVEELVEEVKNIIPLTVRATKETCAIEFYKDEDAAEAAGQLWDHTLGVTWARLDTGELTRDLLAILAKERFWSGDKVKALLRTRKIQQCVLPPGGKHINQTTCDCPKRQTWACVMYIRACRTPDEEEAYKKALDAEKAADVKLHEHDDEKIIDAVLEKVTEKLAAGKIAALKKQLEEANAERVKLYEGLKELKAETGQLRLLLNEFIKTQAEERHLVGTAEVPKYVTEFAEVAPVQEQEKVEKVPAGKRRRAVASKSEP